MQFRRWTPGRLPGRLSRVELRSNTSELAELDWPSDEIEYLAFVAGPGDVRDPMDDVEGSAAAASVSVPSTT